MSHDEPTLALGAPFGGSDVFVQSVDVTLSKVLARRLALLGIDQAATELVLTRVCAYVSMLSCHLRLNGDRLPQECLDSHF